MPRHLSSCYFSSRQFLATYLPLSMALPADLCRDLCLPTDLVLPMDPVYRLPECHHNKFIEKLRNTDPSQRESFLRAEIIYRKAEIKTWREMDQWRKSKSKPINQEDLQQEDEDLETKPHKKHKICSNAQTFPAPLFTNPDGPRSMEYYSRRARSHDTDYFKKGYKFVKGIRTCITSNYMCSLSSEKCFDSTWVAVHGLESICMVTWRDMDMTHLPAYYLSFRAKDEAMPDFAKAVISEVECIPYDDHDYEDDLRRGLGGTIEKPFIVVSAVLDNIKVQLPILNFRKNIRLTSTDYGTIQTAIDAYQHTFDKELRAEDIWVTSFHFPSGIYEHLHIDQISEQLDIFNGRSSAKAPLKWPLFRDRIISPESDDILVCKSSLPASFNKRRLRSLPESLDKCVFHTP